MLPRLLIFARKLFLRGRRQLRVIAPTPDVQKNEDISIGLKDIAAAIHDLESGTADATTAHNAKARTLQIAALGIPSGTLEYATARMLIALEVLENARETGAAFPVGTEPAHEALERLRLTLVEVDEY